MVNKFNLGWWNKFAANRKDSEEGDAAIDLEESNIRSGLPPADYQLNKMAMGDQALTYSDPNETNRKPNKVVNIA